MDILGLLGPTLGPAVAKLLLKRFLQVPDDIAGGLSDVAERKLTSWMDKREAEREFSRLGDDIVRRLAPLFENAAQATLNPEAVAHELRRTLETNVTSEFFVTRDLDAAELSAALHRARPLPNGMFSEAETQLYDRSLDQAVRYVIDMAAALPKFEPAVAAETLQRLRHVADRLTTILDRVQRIETALLQGQEPTVAQRFEADFRLAVLRNLDYLELFGADLSPEARTHSLSVAYISLTVSQPREGNTYSMPVSAPALLAELKPASGRMLIRGEAGGGKSTLLRWIALQAAAAARGDEAPALARAFDNSQQLEDGTQANLCIASSTHRKPEYLAVADLPARPGNPMTLQREDLWLARIPFLISLRDCPTNVLPTPDTFPTLIANELGNAPSNWTTSILREGRAIILLDGVDEIPGVFRETKLLRSFKALLEAFPRNYFIVTCRPTAVPPDWLASFGFREARINPMSDEDKGRFIDRWHAAVAQELRRHGSSMSGLEELAYDLRQKLPAHPSINLLATNPLLCGMICALHRERNKQLPESQAELCETLCETLLHRRELESRIVVGSTSEPYRRLDYPQKKAVVQELAYHMVVRSRESSISSELATEKIAERLDRIPGHRSSDAPEVLRMLVERSGMLRESGPGRIDFLHNTFKEYLAGTRLADESADGLLADNANYSEWFPVIIFAASTQRSGFADQLIRRLLQFPMIQDKSGRRLLALRCLAVAIDVDPSLQAEVHRQARELIPPKTLAEADSLAASGSLVVSLLRFNDALPAEEAAYCVRTLRLIGTDEARGVARGYATDARSLVVQELCQTLNPLEIKAVQSALIRGDNLPDGVRRRIVDLTPVADFPDTEALDLSAVNAIDLRALSKLRNLRTLSLRHTQVTDLHPLSQLQALEELDASRTRVSELSPIRRLVRLQRLDLSHTETWDATALADLTLLEVLRLSGTKITDVSPLASLTQLRELDLSRSNVVDLAPISRLSRLKRLILRATGIRSVASLVGLTALESLDLSFTWETVDLSPLAELMTLREILLRRAAIVDVSALSRIRGLEVVDLYATHVSDIAPLAKLPKLNELDVSFTSVRNLTPLANHPKCVIRFERDIDMMVPDILEGGVELSEPSRGRPRGRLA